QDEINALHQKLRSQSSPVPGAFGSVPTPAFKPQAPQKAAVAEPEKPAPAPAPAPVQVVQHDNSEAAKKLLASAQQVSDQIVSDAKREAEEIVSSARERAENAIGDLEQEKVRVQTEIDTLKASARDYRSRFLRLVEDQTHVINAEMELFKEDE
ncbi:MAG: DivIVA domain-containing protein, partial [Clostridia bacterium]|nr:DivIVA domain-containing protein [Clostridia bacterium]